MGFESFPDWYWIEMYCDERHCLPDQVRALSFQDWTRWLIRKRVLLKLKQKEITNLAQQQLVSQSASLGEAEDHNEFMEENFLGLN